MKSPAVKIPHVAWRQGRPRFSPASGVRDLGHKGEDLRHANGDWFTFEQASAWSITFQAEIAAQRTAIRSGEISIAKTAKAVHRAAGLVTVGQMILAWHQTPRMTGKLIIEGRMERRPLAVKTIQYYKSGSRIIENPKMGSLWHQPAAAISQSHLTGLLHKVEVEHGLSSARMVRATLSAAWKWGRAKYNLPRNPVRDLEITLPVPAPRIRYGSIAEMQALIDVAGRIDRPDVALIMLMGLWTAQRQGDRLSLEGGKVTSEGIWFRQAKRHGQPLLVPAAAPLAKALEQALDRRRDWRINYPQACLDEVTRRPFEASWYNKLLSLTRFIAAHGRAPDEEFDDPARDIKTALSVLRGIDMQKALDGFTPISSLADFRDQDLRDTAVTWLALAGCDEREIASITGHELTSINRIMKHYLGLHPDLAKRGIGKLEHWYAAANQARENKT
ncbi:MAG: hypothetical protein JKY98_05210 [Gammaproteobacteria bacterium]|nr:hypothetical protein [Gammaproteobacteria bacterium]